VTGRSPWLPFGDASGAPARLVCLPHAGAGASGYRVWGRDLPAEIAVCPVQLPGRESRISEQPYQRIEPLVADLAEVVAERVEAPYALFGHSLGALVAFELARRLRQLGVPGPVHLFVSGRHAPQATVDLPNLRDLDLPALAAELAKLGGTPRAVLDNPDLLRAIAPMLLADFTVNETYRHTAQAPLDVPVTAFAGTTDPRGRPEQMAAWQEQTSRDFRLHRVPGGHFAVLQHAGFVHARMVEAMAVGPSALAGRRP
jgi:medium-chain acyl-[acyl-carrier-protein] hydrolase